GSGQYRAILVPDEAIGSDQSQKFVYLVDGQSKAQYRTVKIGPLVDGLRVVREGVGPEDRVVVAGLQRVRPGLKVDAQEEPIPSEVNGVEDMLYMSSQSTTDGNMTLTITFRLGTDLDKAQVLVQNRVAIAEPRLPEDVRRVGVTTLKSSPDLLMVVHLLSPTKRYDQLYIGNFALIRIRDALRRIEGVGDVNLFGLREYSMRVWLDPARLASRNIARIALAARDYSVNSYLDNQPAVAMAIAQLPGSNALQTADSVQRTMEELARGFPEGLTYKIVYNPTVFVRESINEVIHTL